MYVSSTYLLSIYHPPLYLPTYLPMYVETRKAAAAFLLRHLGL